MIEMAKTHHCIEVGMMAIQENGPDTSLLQSSFVSIYTGDSISTYQACNRLHSYGYDFDSSNFWGLQPTDTGKVNRNKIAWVNYVIAIENANNQIVGGNLKGIISRNLMGLRVERGWTLAELDDYVRRICDGLTSARKNLVAGWYLDDDGLPKASHTGQIWRDVINTVHNAQKSKGVNWPFYWADNIDGYDFWSGGQHIIPCKLRDWVSAFPSDAKPIFMPYYYPWASGNWKYTVWPPWRKWQTFMNDLNTAFPVASYPNLKFQPVLEATKLTPTPTKPGHVDVHKQIRVVFSQVRVNGIWFLGWNNDSSAQEGWAKNNWTQANSCRWAEAIQNEPEAQVEGISAAIPATTQILQNFPNPFAAKNDSTGACGTRIPYYLAQRASFQLKIYNSSGILVRTINEGYTGTSPQGKFENGIDTQGSVLSGTSAYWDGKNDQGGIVLDGTYYCYLTIGSTQYGPINMVKQGNC
jgi:hypothetical protein